MGRLKAENEALQQQLAASRQASNAREYDYARTSRQFMTAARDEKEVAVAQAQIEADAVLMSVQNSASAQVVQMQHQVEHTEAAAMQFVHQNLQQVQVEAQQYARNLEAQASHEFHQRINALDQAAADKIRQIEAEKAREIEQVRSEVASQIPKTQASRGKPRERHMSEWKTTGKAPEA